MRLQRHQGFTLVELLIVVAVIGIIAAIAVPNLLTAIQRAKLNKTVANLSALRTALGTYLVDQGYYPRQPAVGAFTAVLLPEQYYQGSLVDGWGNALRYRTDATAAKYVLASAGYGGSFSTRYGSDSYWTNPIRFETFGCRPAYKTPLDLQLMLKSGCDVFVVNGIFPIFK